MGGEYLGKGGFFQKVQLVFQISQSPKKIFQKTILYHAHVSEQPIFLILNILFVYFFIDFFVKHIFFEACLEGE